MTVPTIDEGISIFFPCHNEAANLEALVSDALAAAPGLARTFELIVVDDGSRDATPEIAARLAAADPQHIRVIRHAENRGYGGALRSGFAAARYPWVAFTDGDCQFRVADLRQLVDVVIARPDTDVVLGYRLRRADPVVRRLYAAAYRLANRLWFGLRVRDVDCAMKLFRTRVLHDLRISSSGAFFSAELLIKLRARGVTFAEVGVPHHPRTAGSPTGARPSVIARAIRDFWTLRASLWFDRAAALASGASLREPQ